MAARVQNRVPSADRPVERVFITGSDSYVYATDRLTGRLQAPFFGWVLMSIDAEPVRIRLGTREFSERAMALWGRDVHFVDPAVRFVTIAVNPFHPLFRAFTRIDQSAAIPLDYSRLEPYRELALSALISPRFTQDQALTLTQVVIDVCKPLLPIVAPLDARARSLMTLLINNPRATLDELAQSLNLSYHRTSHLFAATMGITVRTYQLWQKLYLVNDPLVKGANLTNAAHAAGFVDSAHFSRAFQTAYGRSPRAAFKSRRVIVYQRDVFAKSAVEEAIRRTDGG